MTSPASNAAQPMNAARLKARLAQPDFAQTPALRLKGQPVGDAGWTALAEAPTTGHLSDVWLGETGGGNAGLIALSESAHLRPGSLFLESNKFDAVGVAALAKSAILRRLTMLRLALNAVGDRGATALANSPHLTQLVHLDLSACEVGDAGALAVLSSTSLKGLRQLHIGMNPFNTAHLKRLAKPEVLPVLEVLDVSGSRLDEGVKAALRAARPTLTIVSD